MSFLKEGMKFTYQIINYTDISKSEFKVIITKINKKGLSRPRLIKGVPQNHKRGYKT